MLEPQSSQARRVDVIIIHERLGELTSESRRAVDFQWTDNLKEVDDIQITFEDQAGRWKNELYPVEGDMIQAHLLVQNWTKPGDLRLLECGEFSVDDVEPRGMPHLVSVKAVSAVVKSTLRSEAKGRIWENVTIKEIAAQIAKEHSLALSWNHIFAENGQPVALSFPQVDRITQNYESDWAFLRRIGSEYSLQIKVSPGKLMVSHGLTLEGQPEVKTINLQDFRITNYRFHSSAQGVFKACEITYHDPAKGEEVKHTYTPPNAPRVGPTLKINDRAKSQAEAERLAKAKLREKNIEQRSGEVVLEGDPDLVAGNILKVQGHGYHDGDYLIERAVHSTSGTSAYTTSLSLKRAVGF